MYPTIGKRITEVICRMDLASFLTAELQHSSSRVLGKKIGIPHTSVERIAKRQLKGLPEIETLDKIAHAYGLPLWRVLEMAAIDLGLSSGDRQQADRLASLARAFPGLMPAILEGLLDLESDDYEGVLAYIEMQRQLRRQRQASESTDQ